MNPYAPVPADDKPAPEIRGGDRPADYIPSGTGWPEVTVKAGLASASGDVPDGEEDSPGCACGPECPDFCDDDEQVPE